MDIPLRPEKHRWTWKQWVSVSVVCLLLFPGIPALMIFLPIWDREPVDDSIMRVVVTPVPEALNARTDFLKALSVMKVPDGELFWAMLENPDAHREAILELLEQNQEFFHHLEAGIDKGIYQEPWNPDGDAIYHFIGRAPDFANLQTLQWKVEVDPNVQVEQMTRQLKFAGMLMEGSYVYFISTMTQSLTFELILKHLRDQHMGVNGLKKLLEAVQDLPRDTEKRIRLGIVQEYLWQSILWEAGPDGVMERLGEYFGGVDSEQHQDAHSVPPFFYQHHSTHALILEAFLHELHKVDPDFQPDDSRRSASEISADLRRPGRFGLRKYHNQRGKRLFQSLAPHEGIYLKVLRKEQWRRRSLELHLALLLYEREQGILPESLDQMVPEYLSAVPTDPYDGEPIRYDPERQLFYSIGEDGVDQGGTPIPKEDDEDRGDLVETIFSFPPRDTNP